VQWGAHPDAYPAAGHGRFGLTMATAAVPIGARSDVEKDERRAQAQANLDRLAKLEHKVNEWPFGASWDSHAEWVRTNAPTDSMYSSGWVRCGR
jgi:hypothetical protein